MEITLDYQPYDYQLAFHNDDSRFRIICGGRRSGKTKAIIQEVIRHCLTLHGAKAFAVAPTFGLAREVLFEEFMTHYDDLKPVIKDCHLSHMKVKFINNSILYFKGSDNPDSLRGRGLSMYIGDEAAFHKPDVWKLIVRPALSDRKGKAILISTPNGKNWFHDKYIDNLNWKAYHWTTLMNPMISPEEIEDAKREMSDVDFRQEYLAEFLTRAGKVYDDFNEENIIDYIQNIDVNKYDIYLGMDFGFATITCACFIAVDRSTNTVVLFDELYVSHMQMSDIVLKINEILGNHNISKNRVISIFTDPAGNSEELTSGLSPVDELRRAGYNVINKGTQINPGLALVRAFIKNALGERKFKVTNTCKQSIKSLNGYEYNSNRITGLIKEEALKDGIHDHMCDAIRYFFVNKFDYSKYVAKEPTQSSYQKSNTKYKIWKRCGVCNNVFLSHTPLNQPPLVCENHRST